MSYTLTEKEKKLIEKYPNKYNLSPKMINSLIVLDWDRLKEKTWKNTAMSNGPWYCHIEGCAIPDTNHNRFDDEDEFWIGFQEKTGKVDHHFSSYEGMCGYIFDDFYGKDDMSNKFDFGVHVNTIKWLNKMLDEKILGLPNS